MFCSKASGRGRIVLGNETNRFTFQSAITKSHYEIAIDIPFKGQETIKLPLQKPFNFSGSLYEKSVIELKLQRDKTPKNTKKLLDTFLLRTSKFISLLTISNNETCTEEKCLDGVLNFTEASVDYEAPLSQKFVYSALLKNAQNGYYSSLNFKASDPNGEAKALLALDLVVDACEER